MTNPIRNAVVSITRHDLVSCKRCRCPDLAWVKFKSGKWALVKTSGERPLWRGDGPAPEGLFALKFNYHRCEDYLAVLNQAVESERIAREMPHPKADRPHEILADALSYLFVNNQAEFVVPNSAISNAATILCEAAGRISSK